MLLLLVSSLVNLSHGHSYVCPCLVLITTCGIYSLNQIPGTWCSRKIYFIQWVWIGFFCFVLFLFTRSTFLLFLSVFRFSPSINHNAASILYPKMLVKILIGLKKRFKSDDDQGSVVVLLVLAVGRLLFFSFRE